MKTFLLALIAVSAIACGGPKSEFDITPAQAQQHKKVDPGGDLAHLPPGAVKHEKLYHKGDKLPDGTVAQGEAKIVTVDMPGGKGQMQDVKITKSGP